MKLKKWLISFCCILLTFLIAFVAGYQMLYSLCLSYYNEDPEFLDNYFNSVLTEPVFLKATEKTHSYYNIDMGFNFGDVVFELAGYDYKMINEENALEILKQPQVDDNAYQVCITVYSFMARQAETSENTYIANISNIVYFSCDEKIYALAFFNDDNAYSKEYIALFETNIKQYPSEFSSMVFDNHGLIESHFSRIEKLAIKTALKSATIITLIEILCLFVVTVVIRKKNSQSVGNSVPET